MKRSGFLIFYFLYLYAISWSSANLACGEKCSKVGKTPCVDFRKWWEKFLKQLMIAWYSVIGVSGFFVVWGDVGRGQQLSGQQSCCDMGLLWWWVWFDMDGLLWWVTWVMWMGVVGCCGVVTWIVWCGLILGKRTVLRVNYLNFFGKFNKTHSNTLFNKSPK